MTAPITTADLLEQLARIIRRVGVDQRDALRFWLAVHDERYSPADESTRLAIVRKLEKRIERFVAQQATTGTTAADACDARVTENDE